MSSDPEYFRIISEWMPNGNVMEYLNSNPEANRLRLVSPVVHSPRCFMLMLLNNP